jgi:copper chaperone CopZ
MLNGMTPVEVAYRCAVHPTEEVMRALGFVRQVYGVRRTTFNSSDIIIRVEYDATRLNEATISKLLREAGFALAEEISLLPPQVVKQPVPLAPPPK